MRDKVGALAVAVVAATVCVYGQIDPSIAIDNNRQVASLWFVEFASPPTADGTSVDVLEREEAEFHSNAAAAGVQYTETRHFRRLWNGVVVRAAAANGAKLRALAGVQDVYPVREISLSQTESRPGTEIDLVTALKQTGVDVAQSQLGLTGQGVRVGVIDTGIDYHHPDLGGCFGSGCRVVGGFDFVGDAYNPSSLDAGAQIPNPDPDPDDCEGHGTHVSGIIGANGTIKGVAPAVSFYAYRVFGCTGPTTNDIIIAALEMALADQVNVINMSLGSAFRWPQDPLAKAARRLVRSGVNVVASMGNSGALGLYSGDVPGVGEDVLAVASFDNTHANLRSFVISPDDTAIGYSEADGAPRPPDAGTYPLARTGTAGSTDDACGPLPEGSLIGTVALIRRGTCAFAVKALNAQAAGALGVVFYNNIPGPLNITVAPAVITVPVVVISALNGESIDSRLAAGSVDLTWTSAIVSEPQATGDLISNFSSFGPPPDLSFKPDLGAPGGSIRSTLPLEAGGSGNLSGTSMASPHVAGAVALLLEAKPEARPREVQERLMNTARPHVALSAPTSAALDVVHRQGAGMLRIDDAILATARVSPSSIALGEVEAGSAFATLRIRSTRAITDSGGETRRRKVTYTLGHEPALATGANTFTPTVLDRSAQVQFSVPQVTLHGPDNANEAEVVVIITPPPDPDARLFGGYITLTPDDEGPILRVPYTGYNGDYQAISALTPTPAGFPWLAKVIAGSIVNQPNGAAYTLQGTDVPLIVLHLDHQVQRLQLEVIDVATGNSFNFADDEKFLPRNSTPTSAFLFAWDGTSFRRAGRPAREVPNGTYRLELTVLKALGDPVNPNHVERWTSPNITLSRP